MLTLMFPWAPFGVEGPFGPFGTVTVGPDGTAPPDAAPLGAAEGTVIGAIGWIGAIGAGVESARTATV
jgi:hypothetical protein